MTYCVGLDLQQGLVLASDTRTNAGVDHVSTVSKMHVFEKTDERVIVALTAGNLAISQAVINLLTEGLENEETGEPETLMTVPSMSQAALLAGKAIRRIYSLDGAALETQNVPFDVSLLLGGQVKGRRTRLFQVYAAGNFIESTPDTPFLQIGEHKYGKPILDRATSYETDLYDGVKLALISMDSTLRSNMTVGMPIDLMVYRHDTLKVDLKRRITEDDDYFRVIQERWSKALRDAYLSMPRPDWG